MTDATIGRMEALSDRFNPIVVREIQQAFSSRAFVLTLALSVSSVVLLALLFAWGDDGQRDGAEAFSLCLAGLCPIALFLVPSHAFASMRREVTGGTAEQLMLTRLIPRRIVVGKLLAALAQFFVFMAVFAPVMAMTFLLRGVDVPTIAVTLLLIALCCGVATSLSIALGAACRWQNAQGAVQALGSIVLVIGTMASISAAWDLPRDVGRLVASNSIFEMLLSLGLLFGVLIWLFCTIASTAIAHSYENRSSPYRVFAVLVIIGLPTWLYWAQDFSAVHARPFVGIAAFLPWLLFPILVFASCEQDRLSPRVANHVPKNRYLAALYAFFLPGGGRGAAFGILMLPLALLSCSYAGYSTRWGAALVTTWTANVAWILLSWSYVLLLAGIAQALRRRFMNGGRLSFGVFVFVLTLQALMMFIPFVLQLLIVGRVRSEVSLFNLTNPWISLQRRPETHDLSSSLMIMGGLALMFLVLNLRAMIRGFSEVMDASARRRRDAS